MIIIKSVGGLGNQLFQYALYKKLTLSGKEVKIDFSQLHRDNIHNELAVFDSDILEPLDSEIAKLGDCAQNPISKIRRRLGFYKSSHIIEKASYTYDSDILKKDDVYLFGYWQSEKYFSDIRCQLLEAIKFPDFDEEHNIKYVDEIQKASCSVSLHVRRGDYLIDKFRKQYGGICTDQYYKKTVEYFEKKYPDVRFFVFTNDKEWVMQNFQGCNMTIVQGNNGDKSFRDLQLMSLCQHNIIANSSFSWWGAWLNKNTDKIVLMPPMWNRSKPTPDIWVPNWIRMDTPVEDV